MLIRVCMSHHPDRDGHFSVLGLKTTASDLNRNKILGADLEAVLHSVTAEREKW